MSPAASALFRSLLARTSVPRDRILLTDVHSTDWQSLTFVGERHRFGLRVPGPNAQAVVDELCKGLREAEFTIPGHVLADIEPEAGPAAQLDGSISLTIEALTIEE
jgi:hypothetical protein